MLNFLKKIFETEQQEVKTRDINLQELESWLDELSKPLTEEIRQQTENILMKIGEELQKSKFNLESLENAKLQNPNIPFKAKQYMEGNRRAYIRSVSSFLGHMEINNKDYFYLLDFTKFFDELLIDLNKATLRSYTILQEFFANETGKISENLRNFDGIFRDLRQVLKDEKIVLVNSIREKIKNLLARTNQRINLIIDLKGMDAATKLEEEEKNAIMSEIEKFEKSIEHNDFLKLSEEKKAKTSSFYNDENSLLQSFSVLERPLRKYSHSAFEHEEVVLDYLKQPIETLAADKNLEIIGILENLRKSIVENNVQIDDKKKEKSIEEIGRLSREFLLQFLKKYKSHKAEIQELDKKISSSGVPEKFRDLNKRLEETNIRAEKDNLEFGRLKSDMAKLESSIQILKQEIENDIKNISSSKINIVI